MDNENGKQIGGVTEYDYGEANATAICERIRKWLKRKVRYLLLLI